MVKVGEMNVSINVAWMVFPVNCVAMGFLRYGQRYISLYHFGVITFFCTLCDDVGYRQRDFCFYNIDMNTAAATHCADMGHLVYGQGDTPVSIMLTEDCFKRTLYGHVFSVVWRMSGLPYGYFRETHWISMGFREINMVSGLVNMHGPIWQTFETISDRKPCRLFQKFISAARHGRPSTARSHGPLWRTSATIGARNPCRLFQKSIPAARHGQPSTARPHGPLWGTFATMGVKNPRRLFQKSIPAARHDRPSTTRSGWLLKQSAQGSRAICFKSPSQRPVTTGRPRPALTEFWNNRRQESVPFVSKVHPSGPSRQAVHGPLWRNSETIGARNLCRLFQKYIPAVRHGRPSTAGCHGPLWRTSATIGARNPCRLFQKSLPAARHGRPSTARSDELLQQSAPGIRAVCFKSPSQRPVTAGRPRPAPTARSDGLLKQSAPGIRAVCFKSPCRRPVTAGRPRPALTNFCNNRRQESVPFVSKVRPGGPSRPAVHGPTPRPALVDFCNNRREESVPFVSKVHLSGPSRTSVTARSDELLKQTAPHTSASASFIRVRVRFFSTVHRLYMASALTCYFVKDADADADQCKRTLSKLSGCQSRNWIIVSLYWHRFHATQSSSSIKNGNGESQKQNKTKLLSGPELPYRYDN